MSTLRSCLDNAKEAMIAGEIDHAIDLCFHILCSYPKCIEAHCLLGEAYREKGLNAQAEETFRRVLSADPQNLMARWALSILADDKGEHELAIDELTRAFELNSGHPELRQEMAQRLDGRASLTRGALGRLYARGELFDQAASEFRAALSAEPDRLDILVSLAEALWHGNHYADARKICQQILADSPDCLKANVILAHVFHLSGERQKAKNYLDRAAALDPGSAVAEQLTDGMDIEVLLSATQVELANFESINSASGSLPSATANVTLGYEPYDDDIDGDEDDLPFDDGLDFIAAAPLHPSMERAEIPQSFSSWATLDTAVSEITDVNLEPEDNRQATVVDDCDEPYRDEVQAEEIPASQEAAVPDIAEDEICSTQECRSFESLLPIAWQLDTGEGALIDEPAAKLGIESDYEPAEEVKAENEIEEGPPLKAQEVVTEASTIINGAEQHRSAPLEDDVLVCQQKTQAKPYDFQARLHLALAYHRASQPDAAVAEFELVLKGAPDLIGRVIDGLKAVAAANPEHVLAHRRLGDAYMKAGRFQDAIECYNRCLSKQKSVAIAKRR